MRDTRVKRETRLWAAEFILTTGDLVSRVGALERAMAEAVEKQKWSLPVFGLQLYP